jgi:type IV pilus assembly protein PilB
MMWHIGELLIQKKLINWEQLETALGEQKETNELVGEILVRKGFIARTLLYKALAEQNNMRFVDLSRTRINPKAVQLIPCSIAQKFQIMPIELIDKALIVGVPHPLMVWPQNEVKQLANVEKIQCVLCLPNEIEQAIREHYAEEVSSL